MEDLWASEPDIAQLRRAYELLATDPARALEELKKLAGQGSLMAMNYIGHAYRIGNGVEINLTQAEQWFKRAADLGSIPGAYHLAKVYIDSKRYSEAKKILEICVSNGLVPAMGLLGWMALNGIGIEKDLLTAKSLLETAAAKGNLIAKRDLATAFLRGEFGVLYRLMGLWLKLSLIIEALQIGISVSRSEKRELSEYELALRIVGSR